MKVYPKSWCNKDLHETAQNEENSEKTSSCDQDKKYNFLSLGHLNVQFLSAPNFINS